MANVQRMHNDLERSGENDRRRMDSQIKLLEDQKFVPLDGHCLYQALTPHFSQDLRTQLSQEREAVRRVTLQRDLDLKELQNKMEKTVSQPCATTCSLLTVSSRSPRSSARPENPSLLPRPARSTLKSVSNSSRDSYKVTRRSLLCTSAGPAASTASAFAQTRISLVNNNSKLRLPSYGTTL